MIQIGKENGIKPTGKGSQSLKQLDNVLLNVKSHGFLHEGQDIRIKSPDGNQICLPYEFGRILHDMVTNSKTLPEMT